MAFLLLVVVIAGIIAPIGTAPAYAAAAETSFITNFVFGVTDFLGAVVDDPADALVGGPLNVIAVIARTVSNHIMVQGAFLLDLSIDYSIRSEHFRFAGIERAWTIIRDVANITFIFVLLYIAFATILQVSNFNTKKILATLIIVALLINFSFFLTGLVVDASNILSLFIYNAITDNGASPISTQFANVMQITTVFDSASFDTLGYIKRSIANMMSAIVFIIAFFIFLSAAILFVLRTIAIMFVLVLSPIAFAAMILPATRSHFNKWLHNLMNDTQVLSGTVQAIQPKGPDVFQIILGYVLVAGLLAGVLAIARGMAGNMATLAVQYAGRATGAAAGLAAFAGRRGLGPLARAARESETLKKLAKSDSAAARYAGRAAIRTADYGAKSSFDVRATGAAKVAAGGLGAVGIRTDFGRAGGKGGYESVVRKRDERRATVAKNLEKEGDVKGNEERKRKFAEDIYARSPTRLRRAAFASKTAEAEESVKNIMKSFRKTREAQERREDILNAVKKANETLDKEKPSSRPTVNVTPSEKPKESKES